MSNRFTGQTVLVTGAVGGLGEAMAQAFSSEGANVIVGARHEKEGTKLAKSLGQKSMFVMLDVTDEKSWAEAVTKVEKEIGPVSVLVNNAAYLAIGSVEKVEVSEWHKVIETNLTGAFLGIRAVAPSMRKGGEGSIVNINSIAGLHASPGIAAYGASKWGIRGLTLTAAYELSKDKIRVNAVHAGIIDTPLAADPKTGAPLVPVDKFAIPRQADTKEIAKYVLFVASADAAFSTGNEFVADGGFGLGPIS